MAKSTWSKRTVFIMVLGAVAGVASAQDEGVKLGKEELEAFMPGQKVMHVAKSGSTRRWTNEPDGSLLASWAPLMAGSGKFGGTGKGTWNVSREGKYCVSIDWTDRAEKWCRFIYRTDSGFMMSRSDEPGAEREKIGFTK